jgi:hypothetical protein
MSRDWGRKICQSSPYLCLHLGHAAQASGSDDDDEVLVVLVVVIVVGDHGGLWRAAAAIKIVGQQRLRLSPRGRRQRGRRPSNRFVNVAPGRRAGSQRPVWLGMTASGRRRLEPRPSL